MILLINKPKGWTSFDVVNFIRNKKRIKVGHAGTLDPFATGLLIVAVGREDTKRLDEFQHLSKTYVAILHLGATSNTLDSTGVIQLTINKEQLTSDTTRDALKSFVGKQKQIPPMFSAKKIGGVRLYEFARQGKTIEREPCEIEIYKINLLDYDYPLLKIEVECSSGTYIRALADDIGKKLGVEAYCEELERTRIGEYKLSDAKDLAEL